MEHDHRRATTSVTPALRFLGVPAVLIATLSVASCGTSSGGTGASGTKTSGTTQATGAPSARAIPTGAGTPAKGAVSSADVSFATMMIPQNAQAVAMANLALKEATSAKVKALAPEIKKAAAPEIARMSGWFTSVGSPAPGSAGYHDMSSMGGMASQPDGMMSAKAMTTLKRANGPAFDRMWLQMMVKNREGAVSMAKTELAKGGSPDVKQAAQSIIDSQPKRIAEMTRIMAGATR